MDFIYNKSCCFIIKYDPGLFYLRFYKKKITNKILLYDVTFNMMSLLHYIIKISVGIVYVTSIFPNNIF